jgi:hypothetical protein
MPNHPFIGSPLLGRVIALCGRRYLRYPFSYAGAKTVFPVTPMISAFDGSRSVIVTAGLYHQFLHHAPRHIRQPEITTAVLKGKVLVIQSQQMQNSRM